MGLFDFFKKKKPKIGTVPEPSLKEKKIEEKEAGEKVVKKKEKVEKESPEARPRAVRPKKKVSGIAYKVLASPHVTEKATGLGEVNKYVFKVLPRVNKIEIKKTIEGLYGVDVLSVKIINIPKRKRRLGRQKGWRKGYKKAIVKIKEGQKIEIMPR